MGDEVLRLQKDVALAKAEAAAHAEGLAQAKERQRELADLAARAEAAVEKAECRCASETSRADSAQVAAETAQRQREAEVARATSLEEMLQKRDVDLHRNELEGRLQQANIRSRHLEEELKEEQQRSDELERRVHQLSRDGSRQLYAIDEEHKRTQLANQDFESRALRAEALAKAAEEKKRMQDWVE